MTIGVCWEFFEFISDKYFFTDMQKDIILNNFSSVEFNENISNKAITLNDVHQTIIYNKQGDKIASINNGYLDIGLYDTMADLFVNLLGALIFSLLGYFYVLNKNKYKFIQNFLPTKSKKIN